ncbi:MAG TPA: L,D-transpeptidase [Jatrophihabitans sp.]
MVIVVGVLVVGGAGALLIAGMARPVLSFADDTQKRAIHGDVTSSVTSSAPVAPASASATSTAPPVPANFCADNTEPRRVIVSLKAQHAWYCAAGKTVFDTAVTTGMATDATRTPKGHFTIQTKLRDTVLNPDTGEAYPVKYWIAFKGSEYGFHDASWQKVGFGSKGYQSGGSHGCVHLPLKAVKYLYSWAKVGTAVTIA